MFIFTLLLKFLPFSFMSYSLNVFPKPLKKCEEELLIKKLLEKDPKARELLIEHNLRLVAHIVKRYTINDKNQDDLISIGTIGLIKGIDSFNPNKNNKLTTYAARCIENEILMYYRSNKKNTKTISLNDSIGYDKDGNEINIIDIIKEENKDYLEDIHKKDLIKLLIKYLDILKPIEKEIIIKRYGLFNEKELTQKELANLLNISRSYVSRIETKSLKKIKHEFKKNNQEL